MVVVLEWAQSRLRAEALIALGAFLVGMVDIVTAIRPTLTDRYDLFQAMLPTGTTTLAGSITFAAGAALLLLAGGLARRKHRAWLERKLYEPFGGRTVVITHFAPHPKSIAPAYTGHPANPGFVLDLSPLMGRAALWIHGHTHTAFDYEVKGTRVVCNPRGYPGEPTGFRADLILDL